MALEQPIRIMEAWVKRREDAGKNWTDNELWSRIQQNWPGLSEQDRETIFQGIRGRRP